MRMSVVNRWFVFGRSTRWGVAPADLSYRSMNGHGRSFGGLESLPSWLYWVGP